MTNTTAFSSNGTYATLKATMLTSYQRNQFKVMVCDTLKHDFKYEVEGIIDINNQIVFAFNTKETGKVEQLFKYISYALSDYEEYLEKHSNCIMEIPQEDLIENVKNPMVEDLINQGHFLAVAFDEMEGLNEHAKVSSVPTLKEITQALSNDEAMVNCELVTDEVNYIGFKHIDTPYQLDTVNIVADDYMEKHVDYNN